MKKFSLLLTAFVIILSLCIPNFTSAKAFPDVQSNHWAIKEINYLSDKGIINGTPEGYFKPSDNVTRGQMALMLDLSLRLEKPSSYNHIFSDVTKGIYYYDSVHKLAHNNIVQRETNYFPDRSLSQPFLDAVKPSIAVISAGAGNRYGHPTQETLAKLNAMSVNVYRTDLNGTVVINSDGSNISVRTER
ncbi:S-layer homology domain-containing protein [Bacillus cereus group sp. MYBK79-1]|uniref:S-layer homology domain-containing protein n=1 Tax=unclassified Bacillus cereus group TaxID=2750818 RepID=UPI003F79ADDC